MTGAGLRLEAGPQQDKQQCDHPSKPTLHTYTDKHTHTLKVTFTCVHTHTHTRMHPHPIQNRWSVKRGLCVGGTNKRQALIITLK